MHNHNIIHRDIKASNIFLTKNNVVKVFKNFYIFFSRIFKSNWYKNNK